MQNNLTFKETENYPSLQHNKQIDMILWLENIINFHTKYKQYDSKHMKDNPLPTQKCTNIVKHMKRKEID